MHCRPYQSHFPRVQHPDPHRSQWGPRFPQYLRRQRHQLTAHPRVSCFLSPSPCRESSTLLYRCKCNQTQFVCSTCPSVESRGQFLFLHFHTMTNSHWYNSRWYNSHFRLVHSILRDPLNLITGLVFSTRNTQTRRPRLPVRPRRHHFVIPWIKPLAIAERIESTLRIRLNPEYKDLVAEQVLMVGGGG